MSLAALASGARYRRHAWGWQPHQEWFSGGIAQASRTRSDRLVERRRSSRRPPRRTAGL